MRTLIRQTKDAFLGPEDEADWEAWHQEMLALRRAPYPEDAWSRRCFRQYFLFMYDRELFADGRYRTKELVTRLRAEFGRVDSVLLWHAYPRIGFDTRGQFDFYRHMPGGLGALRADVVDVLHAHGLRVFVDYNPWADGGLEELGEIVDALDADGVMLDTMAGAPDALASAVRPGTVLAPELRPRDEDLPRLWQSWAQWSELGEGASLPRTRWLAPGHRAFSIRRWDASRWDDIVYSFFHGDGLLLWDDVFGSIVPYAEADRRLLAETGRLLDAYEDVFARGEWTPLVPTGVPGLDANHWRLGDRRIVTLRNRTDATLSLPRTDDALVPYWGDAERIVVPPRGVQALAEPLARPDVARTTKVRRAPVLRPPPRAVGDAGVALPAGRFEMVLRHERRECGCYPLGASEDLLHGWFYRDVVEHRIPVTVPAFSMRRTAVTNAEFLAFVHGAGYVPRSPARFLAHLRGADGALLHEAPPELAALPVTYVSLDDARAFAAAHGERLPTEGEWHWAAEGAGQRNRYPWGNEPRSFAPTLRSAHDEATATPQGVLGLSGNAWELTESEWTDGCTRFVMLRGGVFLPPAESEWIPPRGARPNDFHAKYLLLDDGLDRSEAISFRTVADA